MTEAVYALCFHLITSIIEPFFAGITPNTAVMSLREEGSGEVSFEMLAVETMDTDTVLSVAKACSFSRVVTAVRRLVATATMAFVRNVTKSQISDSLYRKAEWDTSHE